MKKLALNIICFLLLLPVFGQEKINRVNDQGQRVGLWKKYYNNKKIRYQGQFKNGKEIGVFKFYSISSSDHPIIVKFFSENSNQSQVQFFSEKGVLESEGRMNGKDRIGKWLYYKSGNKVVIEESYKKGKLSGMNKIFYPNGKLTEISYYENGKLHGNSRRYSDTGTLLDDINYVNGEIHGIAIYYDGNGKVKQKGKYEKDIKVGVWEFYNDGKLTKSIDVKSTPIKGD